MSIILAIETSSEIASVALLTGQHCFFRQTDGVMNHSQSILPMVQQVLSDAEIRLNQCDAIAFGAGPGSFTGVRTACGVTQGLAFGADLPVISVVTLAALAESARRSEGATSVLAAIDARMGEVYWAEYCFDEISATWTTVAPPALSAPDCVRSVSTDRSSLIGSGFAAYRHQFSLPAAQLAAATAALPHAEMVGWLAQVEFAAGRTGRAAQAQPLYLRNKIALTSVERLALVK